MKLFAMLAAACCLTLAACGPSNKTDGAAKARVDGQEVSFGILRTEAQAQLAEVWDPFLKDMRAQTGLNIKEYYSTDYAALIQALAYDKVQVAWLSNKSGMEALDRGDLEVFARTVKYGQEAGYYSIVLVPADSKIKTIDDLFKCDKSLTFGIGDPNSTSGYLVPSLYLFAPRGIEPQDCFKTVRTADHEANALGVISKQLDAAVNNSSQLDRIKQLRPKDYGKVREIWRSPLIQNDPLVWQKKLDPDIKGRIMTFFMTYGRSGDAAKVKREREILKALEWDPFYPSSDAHLFAIRDMQARRDLIDAEHDKALSAADRAAKVAAARAKIAEIGKLMAEAPPL
ncbi:MAG: phosphate/phosphite/phosphonate ABC transporter substrate-binding protein [Hyphomonadaceae bacterium]